MSNIETVQIEILTGPSREGLVGSMFSRKAAGFVVRTETGKIMHEIQINGVEAEDGSGQSFIFKGYLMDCDRSVNVEGWYKSDGKPQMKGSDVIGFIKMPAFMVKRSNRKKVG